MENKKLVETVAENLGRTQDDVNKLLEALSNALVVCCGDMDSVIVPGFGTFEAKKKDERVMRHPATGQRMLVPPKLTLNFKLSNVLKMKINKKGDAAS